MNPRHGKHAWMLTDTTTLRLPVAGIAFGTAADPAAALLAAAADGDGIDVVC